MTDNDIILLSIQMSCILFLKAQLSPQRLMNKNSRHGALIIDLIDFVFRRF